MLGKIGGNNHPVGRDTVDVNRSKWRLDARVHKERSQPSRGSRRTFSFMDDMQRIFAVRAYARTHDDGGWDILKAVWTNQEIAKATRGASTPEDCVARIAKTLWVIDDVREAARDAALWRR